MAEKGAMGPLQRTLGAAAALALGLAVAPGCTTTTQVDPVGLELNRPVQAEALRAWRLLDGSRTLGYAIEFGHAGQSASDTLTVYSVRNPWQQELGTIDGLGRAWRFRPHESEAAWVTTGALREGVLAILEAPPGALLEAIPLAALEGSSAPPGEARR